MRIHWGTLGCLPYPGFPFDAADGGPVREVFVSGTQQGPVSNVVKLYLSLASCFDKLVSLPVAPGYLANYGSQI